MAIIGCRNFQTEGHLAVAFHFLRLFPDYQAGVAAGGGGLSIQAPEAA